MIKPIRNIPLFFNLVLIAFISEPCVFDALPFVFFPEGYVSLSEKIEMELCGECLFAYRKRKVCKNTWNGFKL